MIEHSSNSPKTVSAAKYLLKGFFKIRNLDEAYSLSAFLAEGCPDPRMALIGINEILVNAIEHGNLGISFEDKSKLQVEDIWLLEIDRRLNLPQHKNQYVSIELTRNETELILQITDQGHGFDWQKYHTANLREPLAMHGRGILMAKKLTFKKLEYSGAGNIVTGVISLMTEPTTVQNTQA